MKDPIHNQGGIVEVGVAGAPLELGGVSGDLHVVAPFDGGVLIAAIDGLGHGAEAAAAAAIAAHILRSNAGTPPAILVQRCHEALHRTRGVAMSVAALNATDDSLTWLGIGNVEGILLRPGRAAPRRESLALRGGVLGYQLPALRPVTLSVSPHDTLILATDGIRARFTHELDAFGSVEQIAQTILGLYSKGSDDALVVVARYRGRGA